MQCDQNATLLASYLDGELVIAELEKVQQHISNCSQCASEVAEMVRLKRELRQARAQFAPSSEFRRKVQSQLARPERRPVVFRFLPLALAAIALLVVFIGATQYMHREAALAEVADLHVNALASANPLDVVSTDRHTVKPWFQGRVPFSFNVPEFSGTEFTLLGGKMVYLHQEPAAQLIVGLRQHKISVLIVRDSSLMSGAFPMGGSTRNRNSFAVDTWASEQLRFFIVGDVEISEIDRLAHLFQQANR